MVEKDAFSAEKAAFLAEIVNFRPKRPFFVEKAAFLAGKAAFLVEKKAAFFIPQYLRVAAFTEITTLPWGGVGGGGISIPTTELHQP